MCGELFLIPVDFAPRGGVSMMMYYYRFRIPKILNINRTETHFTFCWAEVETRRPVPSSTHAETNLFIYCLRLRLLTHSTKTHAMVPFTYRY